VTEHFLSSSPLNCGKDNDDETESRQQKIFKYAGILVLLGFRMIGGNLSPLAQKLIKKVWCESFRMFAPTTPANMSKYMMEVIWLMFHTDDLIEAQRIFKRSKFFERMLHTLLPASPRKFNNPDHTDTNNRRLPVQQRIKLAAKSRRLA
jgi:hypothetical protein